MQLQVVVVIKPIVLEIENIGNGNNPIGINFKTISSTSYTNQP